MRNNIEQPTAVLLLRARHLSADGHDWEAEERAIALQRESCITAAEQLGAEVIAEYVEHGGAGSIAHRPRVRMMLDELRILRDVNYVIVDTADRLTRRVADWEEIRLELEAAGARLIVARELLDGREEAA